MEGGYTPRIRGCSPVLTAVYYEQVQGIHVVEQCMCSLRMHDFCVGYITGFYVYCRLTIVYTSLSFPGFRKISSKCANFTYTCARKQQRFTVFDYDFVMWQLSRDKIYSICIAWYDVYGLHFVSRPTFWQLRPLYPYTQIRPIPNNSAWTQRGQNHAWLDTRFWRNQIRFSRKNQATFGVSFLYMLLRFRQFLPWSCQSRIIFGPF